jgi:hypothetical protein
VHANGHDGSPTGDNTNVVPGEASNWLIICMFSLCISTGSNQQYQH